MPIFNAEAEANAAVLAHFFGAALSTLRASHGALEIGPNSGRLSKAGWTLQADCPTEWLPISDDNALYKDEFLPTDDRSGAPSDVQRRALRLP
jgi:hypothetical protein